jgi:hypothetical protein
MGTGKTDKREPVLYLFAPTGADTASLSEPGEGAFDHPASSRIAQFAGNGTFRLFRFVAPSTMLDMRGILRLFKRLVDIIVIVAFVRTQMLLNFFRVRSLDYNREDEVVGRPFVMLVGGCQMDCQRRAKFIYQNVDFGSTLASVGRILACFFTTKWGRARLAINRLPFPANSLYLSIIQHHLGQRRLKNAQFPPQLETVVEGGATYTKPTSLNRFPLASRPHDVPDAVQHCSIIGWRAAWQTRSFAYWKQMLNPVPQFIRHFKVVHVFRFCVTILVQDVFSLEVGFGKPILLLNTSFC